MGLVRLYGVEVGHGSAGTVTEGWRHALKAHGMIDELDVVCPPAAVVTSARQLMPALGSDHKEIWYVLALHSDWMPPELAAMLTPDERVHIAAPSYDTLRHLDKCNPELSTRSMLVNHAVDKGFEPLTDAQRETLPKSNLWAQLRPPNPDALSLLHMCESSPERKGTYTLLKAFAEYKRESGNHPIVLTIIPSSFEHPKLRVVVEQMGLANDVRILPRLNAAPEKLKWVYACFDAIVQPSRAEGFGLIPLEGLVMGTPCAVTLDNGHAEWGFTGVADDTVPGLSEISAELPGPPLFEPAPAPVVTVEGVQCGLDNLVFHYARLKNEARLNADLLRAKWTWPRVTQNWADELKGRLG